MIPPHARIVLATQPVDFRNYAERTIMRSPRRLSCDLYV